LWQQYVCCVHGTLRHLVLALLLLLFLLLLLSLPLLLPLPLRLQCLVGQIIFSRAARRLAGCYTGEMLPHSFRIAPLLSTQMLHQRGKQWSPALTARPQPRVSISLQPFFHEFCAGSRPGFGCAVRRLAGAQTQDAGAIEGAERVLEGGGGGVEEGDGLECKHIIARMSVRRKDALRSAWPGVRGA
jgi:hypothetical protein